MIMTATVIIICFRRKRSHRSAFSFFFREILMTASANIKTPSMDLPLKPGPKAKKRAKQLQRKFTKVTLAQVRPTCVSFGKRN